MENKQLFKALLKARSEMSAPVKDKTNPLFKSKYATLDSIYNEVVPALINNGLLLTNTVELVDDRYIMAGTVFHESGESMTVRFPMVIEKQTAHGMASARSYACKYIALNLMALPSEDDDGNAASGEDEPKVGLTKPQQDMIKEAVAGDVGLLNRIVKAYGVNQLSEIDANEFKTIMDKIALTIKHRKAQ